MKAKGMILLAIIALIGVLGVNAQEIIPVDEVQKLNEVQKQMIKSVKKEIKSGIVLPIEVNYLSGDTAKKSHYKMKPIWEKGYFVDRDSAELIIPLQNDSIDLLQCQMRWSEVDDKKYMLIVETILGNVDIEGLFSGSMVYSNYNGCFIRVYNFNKGECVEIVTNNIDGDVYFPKKKYCCPIKLFRE